MTLDDLKGHTLHCPDCGPPKDTAAFKVTLLREPIHRTIEKTPEGLVVKLDNAEIDGLICCECGYGGDVEDFMEDVHVDERGEPY